MRVAYGPSAAIGVVSMSVFVCVVDVTVVLAEGILRRKLSNGFFEGWDGFFGGLTRVSE